MFYNLIKFAVVTIGDCIIQYYHLSKQLGFVSDYEISKDIVQPDF
jgi:hypothetical protein